MVGLNYEMRRELAWRQYPVVSTATFFANFWGARRTFRRSRRDRHEPPRTNSETNHAQVVLSSAARCCAGTRMPS